ncbi:MAG: hypothetical protein LBU39_01395 [Desulfobulbaceae bacterium]|nr:hypothetical protein [Desulfobulbaceae bacterium]
MSESEKSPISYHTFLFPFRWEFPEVADEKLFMAELRRRLSEDWWSETASEREAAQARAWEQDNSERNKRYATYQYLTGPARRLAFVVDNESDDGENSSRREPKSKPKLKPVYHFAFRPNADPEALKKRKYRIKKGDDTYELDIRAIRLGVYNTGVATLIFALEYHGVKHSSSGAASHAETAVTLEDINKINEYGRRINLPYIADLTYRLTADRIIIELEDDAPGQPFFDDFDVENHPLSLTYVMTPIKKLLGLGAELQPLSDKGTQRANQTYRITPAIDDRMYVVCLYKNDELIHQIKNTYAENDYSYLTDWQCAQRLYQFAFIEKDCTCQSRNMIVKILREVVYDRWIEYGTIHAATHHSLMMLTTTGAPSYVIDPFLTIYAEMAIIALAQRATILKLSDQAAKIAEKYDPINGCDKKLRDEIAKLHDRHIRAENQMLLNEITTQEQGEEVFPMLQRGLFIERSREKLGQQLENLYAIARDSYARGLEETERRITKAMLVLAALVVPGCWSALGISNALFCDILPLPLWIWLVSGLSWAMLLVWYLWKDGGDRS